MTGMDSGGATANEEELGVRALGFAVSASNLDSMVQLERSLLEAIAPMGMTAAASGLVSGPKADSPDQFHFAGWPADWAAYYTSHDFLLVDPLPRWARNSGAPITWSGLFASLSPRDPGRDAIDAGKRFGFNEGMAVPTRSADNYLGLVAFGGPRERLSPVEQAYLTMVARAAFEGAERIANKGDIGRAAPILSAREIDCIKLVVRGHSDRQIGKLLGLSDATVRFHLANARTKSGAVSRTHLAALAVARGYVTL